MHTEFTPVMSLAGGMIIGLAAVILMATNGRIAGISGILSQLLPPSASKSTLPTGLAFVAGLLLAAPLFKLVTGTAPLSTMVASPLLLIIAGLIVGFGTGTGNGCTSGHGVCGLSRFSSRSMVATAIFMLFAGVTVYVLRHIIGVAQ